MNKPNPKPGERRYVDLDEETGLYCIFGEESGFAYASYSSCELADEALINYLSVKGSWDRK